MKHQPATDEEIAKEGLLEPGVYDFTVFVAKEKVSKSGNDMFELQLTVYDDNGKERLIKDWVLPSFKKKFKHLHDTLDILDVYEKGTTLEGDLTGKSGKVELGISKPNDQGAVFNVVVDYVKRESNVSTKGLKEELSDDIPF